MTVWCGITNCVYNCMEQCTADSISISICNRTCETFQKLTPTPIKIDDSMQEMCKRHLNKIGAIQ